MSRKICIGVILAPHGVRGRVKLGSFTASPEDIFAYRPVTDESGAREFKITRRSVGADHFIVAIEGVETRTQAEGLKGTELFVERAALPESKENEYYNADLVGLAAQDQKGKEIGKVISVHDYGAGVFLEIKPEKSASFMLPFKKDFVPDVKIEEGHLLVNVPDGWLKEEKEKTK